jgi:hypothetical protein
MSLNQKKTMQVFNKTCINHQSTMSFAKPSDLSKQPLTDIKKNPKIIDYKKSYPMIIG